MPSPGSDQPEGTHQPRSDMPLQPLSHLPIFGSASDSRVLESAARWEELGYDKRQWSRQAWWRDPVIFLLYRHLRALENRLLA